MRAADLPRWPSNLADAIAVVEALRAAQDAALRADAVAAGASLSDPRWWAMFGLCAQTDPDLFEAVMGPVADVARDICAACPVAAQCRAYALDSRERFHIWGGLTRADRRRIWAAAGIAQDNDLDDDEDEDEDISPLELAS